MEETFTILGRALASGETIHAQVLHKKRWRDCWIEWEEERETLQWGRFRFTGRRLMICHILDYDNTVVTVIDTSKIRARPS
jgi:hypothetical protein